jgi:hypothetical protein
MHWLMRLYPRIWRERYEEEMLALLEEHKITAATIIDLLIGALDANLNYDGGAEGVMKMVNRLRSGIVMFFCSFMVFGIGWSLLQRNPMNQFLFTAKFHPEFIILNKSIFIIGGLSFLAFLIGGLPVFLKIVKRAIKSKQKDVLTPLYVAVSCLFLTVISTVILANWQHILFARAHMITFFICYFITFLILLLIGTISVSLMIVRTEFQMSELKFVFIPKIVVLFCMVVSVIMSTIYFITLIIYASQLSHAQYIGSLLFVMGILLMALAAIFAALGLKRGIIKNFEQLIQV